MSGAGIGRIRADTKTPGYVTDTSKNRVITRVSGETYPLAPLKEGRGIRPSIREGEQERLETTTEETEVTMNETTSKPMCDYFGCETEAYAKGICYRHYRLRWRRPEGVALVTLEALPVLTFNVIARVAAETGRTAEQVLTDAVSVYEAARR